MNRKSDSKNGKSHTRIGKGMTQLRPVQPFHLKLKHLLAGVSFLSLFAAFEVFSIPAGNLTTPPVISITMVSLSL